MQKKKRAAETEANGTAEQPEQKKKKKKATAADTVADTADTLAALAASELPVQEEEDGAQAVEPAEKKKKKKKKQAEDSEMVEAAGELSPSLIATLQSAFSGSLFGLSLCLCVSAPQMHLARAIAHFC